MNGDFVREIVVQDDCPNGGIAIPDGVNPVPGKWHYDATLGFYPDPQLLQIDMTTAIQNHLDDYSSTKGYDGILSAVSYAGSTHPVFGPQGVAARDWRDACWTKGIDLLNQVEAGTLVCPSEDELIALMPAPGW